MNNKDVGKKANSKRIIIIVGVIIAFILFLIVIDNYVINLMKKDKTNIIKKEVGIEEEIKEVTLVEAKILNNNINLFIKEFNKKYKTGYIYKIKAPKEKEREKEKSIETIEKLYGIQNAISEITYAIKSGKKGNDPNKVILNMRRYQAIPEEIRMLDNKLGSLIEEMNKKYKTKFMYKVKVLDSETNKRIKVSDINYISAMSSQIEDMYNFIRR